MQAQRGIFIIIAIIFILIFGFLGIVTSYLLINRATLSSSSLQGLKTFYIAESGYEIVLRQLSLNISSGGTQGLSCAQINGASNLTNAPMDGGQFTITTVGTAPNNTSNTLQTAATATDTTLTLNSTSGFAPYGQASIDNEVIYYNSVVGNTLIGVQRGRDGTVAAVHALAATIAQNQCTVNITASIPIIAAPVYTHQITTAIPIPISTVSDGWAAGDGSGTNLSFARWNNPNTGVFNNTPLNAAAINLNSITVVGSDDMWAGGNAVQYGTPAVNRLILGHWDGQAWALPAIDNPPSSATIYGIACISTNNCWAVGGIAGSTPTIARWNGSSWSIVPSGIASSRILRSVSCGDATHCMAVGDTTGTNPLITQWTAASGSWATLTPQTAVNTSLNSVFCNTASDCWAVGDAAGGTALILKWDGLNWTRVNPTVAIPQSLNSLFCNGSNDCWAVGNNLAGNRLLVEHYTSATGTWFLDNNNLSIKRDLYSVSCFDVNNCWAVGQNATFVKYSNGAWAVVAAPAGYPNVNINAISLYKGGNAMISTFPSVGGMWGHL